MIIEITARSEETSRELFTAYSIDATELLIQLIYGVKDKFAETTYGYIVSVAENSNRWDEALAVFKEFAQTRPEQCERLVGSLATALLLKL